MISHKEEFKEFDRVLKTLVCEEYFNFYTPIFEEVDQYTKIVQPIILNNDDKKIFIAECKV